MQRMRKDAEGGGRTLCVPPISALLYSLFVVG